MFTLFVILGEAIFLAWPVSLSFALGFAVYAWIQWQGPRWKVAALVPAPCIITFRFVSLRDEGQLGPMVQLSVAGIGMIAYCITLGVARYLR
jgi:hypothetical protein